MLYDAYQFARGWMAPAACAAQAWTQAWTDPKSPWAQIPGAALIAAGPEVFHRLAKDYPKPVFGIAEVEKEGRRIAVVEEQADHTPFCRLVGFRRLSDDPAVLARLAQEPAVLVVAPLSGHHATLLRDTVRALLRDHQVWVMDWQDARHIPLSEGPFGLDDYVATVDRFVEKLGASRLHIMAVCQPVVPVLGMAALRASAGHAAPRSLVLMGGPIDPRQSPTAVNNLATRRPYAWFENQLIHRVPAESAGRGRKVYPGFLQHMGFVAMNPEHHAKAHWGFFENLLSGDREDAQAHRTFYDEYNAVLDMPAEYYLDTIRTVFQECRLPRGVWEVVGRPVRPQDIRETALMTIEGERDDIAGQGQTRAAHALCSGLADSQRTHLLAAGAGHYGLFSGRRWREEICPQVAAFIRRHEPPAVVDR